MPGGISAVIARWHLVEYACECGGTALMMAFGVTAASLLWATNSPIPAIPVERLRLLATGVMLAGGATLVVYSPLGQRSGGHLNPAVTLAFWRLGKIRTADAIAYGGAQIAGAISGVAVARLLAGDLAREVRFGLTSPGAGVTAPWAIAYEVAITFALVFVILTCLNWPRVAPYTGICAGSLVAVLVMLEAPLTGTSLNPARSLAPAVHLQDLSTTWIYFVGPPLGALLAVSAWKGRWGSRQSFICAKLYHGSRPDRIFAGCPYIPFRAGETIVREGDAGDAAYVLDSGRVEVRKIVGRDGVLVLATLGPGDWFGEMGVLLGERRSASIVGVTDGRVRRITRETFEQAMIDDPKHAVVLLRQLAGRVRDANQRLLKGV